MDDEIVKRWWEAGVFLHGRGAPWECRQQELVAAGVERDAVDDEHTVCGDATGSGSKVGEPTLLIVRTGD